MNLQVASFYVAVLAALLTGCGGGGGGGGGGGVDSGGGGVIRPDDPGTPPVTGVNPARITIPDGETVIVAVVDSGARTSHREFVDVIASTYNVIDGSTNVSDDSGHGTGMASIIAGKTHGYSGNAKLMIVKAAEEGVGTMSHFASGYAYAAKNGARIINNSSSGWQTTFADDIELTQSIVDHDAILLNAAGNGGLNNGIRMPSAYFLKERPDLKGIRDRMLVVGTLNAAGTGRDSSSDYPGSNRLLQDRFLLAPGLKIAAANVTSNSSYRDFSGTSVATAVASAAAASVLSTWPHLNATEATSILLDTANRDHHLYSKNNCGSTKNLNCGAFYMGKGILDPSAALKPVGPLSLALTESVSGPAASLEATSMTVSPAFGDSFSSLADSPVAAFDAYGRDYAVNLNVKSARTGLDRFGGLGAFMQRGPTQRTSLSDSTSVQYVDARMRFNADGSPAAASLSYQMGDTRVTGYRFGYGESSPRGDIEVLDDLPLLSYTGTHAVAADYPAVTGMNGSVPSGIKGVRLGFDAWYANTSRTGLASNDQSAARSEVSMQYEPTSWLRLSAGMASLTERAAMLGTKGYGALGFSADAGFTSRTLSVDIMPFEAATIFARYETGHMDDVGGSGVIDSIKGIRASQFAAGMAYASADYRAAFVASSPLHVDSATAAFKAPTGRTLDGQVTFDRRTANLSPSGRERTFEFAFAARASQYGTVQLNLSRTLESGHNSASKAENMVALNYTTLF